MPDSLLTIGEIAQDRDIRERVASAVVVLDPPDVDPEQWPIRHGRRLAASPGFAAAWDSAVASRIPRPGADPAVISDPQLLAAVQHLLDAGHR